MPEDLNLTRCDEGKHFVRGQVRALTIKIYDYDVGEWKSRTTTACEVCVRKLRQGEDPTAPD